MSIQYQRLAHELREAAYVCGDNYNGQGSACYRVQCGQWHELGASDLERAAWELRSMTFRNDADGWQQLNADNAADTLDQCAEHWDAVLEHL